MIYTLTMNPSLDYIMTSDKIVLGATNRSQRERITFGGKGINVSVMLRNLGIESKVLGFIGGFTGRQIEKGLNSKGIATDFIELQGEESRINVKLEEKSITEINANGPRITDKQLEKLYDKLLLLKKGDYLVLAGSVPNSVRKDIYIDIMKCLGGRDINFVVDTHGEMLKKSVARHPFLVKPNHSELGELFNTDITTDKDAIYYGKKLVELGAQNVFISMGKEGGCFVSEKGESYHIRAPFGKAVYSVGAGDSCVAGFLSKILEGKSKKEAFIYGIAAGSATAFSEGIGSKKLADQLYFEGDQL